MLPAVTDLCDHTLLEELEMTLDLMEAATAATGLQLPSARVDEILGVSPRENLADALAELSYRVARAARAVHSGLIPDLAAIRDAGDAVRRAGGEC
jgi:hypothetical protein